MLAAALLTCLLAPQQQPAAALPTELERLVGLPTAAERRTAASALANKNLATTAEWAGHHPRLCAFTTETMRAVFEAMGCKDTRIERARCVSNGNKDCHAILHYRD